MPRGLASCGSIANEQIKLHGLQDNLRVPVKSQSCQKNIHDESLNSCDWTQSC